MNKKFSKGEVIFCEGDNGDTFFEVVSGTVGIYTNYREETEQKLTDITSGHIFGEMALIDAFPRSATAVALEDVVLKEVFVNDVRDYFKNSPDKVTFILKELGDRLGRLTDEYGEACATIKELYPEDNNRKPSLADKIKKFVAQYEFMAKAKQPSAEAVRETAPEGHGEGFSKEVEKYNKGTIIFREGEAGKCMYDIHSGSVGIYTGYGTPTEKNLTTLYSDKFFGEVGMLGNEPRTATAVVLEDNTTIETIYPADFEELFQKNPAKIEMVIRHLSFRIRRLTYEYVNACKMIYDAADAELKNSVNEELRKKAQEYKENYYG